MGMVREEVGLCTLQHASKASVFWHPPPLAHKQRSRFCAFASAQHYQFPSFGKNQRQMAAQDLQSPRQEVALGALAAFAIAS